MLQTSDTLSHALQAEDPGCVLNSKSRKNVIGPLPLVVQEREEKIQSFKHQTCFGTRYSPETQAVVLLNHKNCTSSQALRLGRPLRENHSAIIYQVRDSFLSYSFLEE